MTRTGWAIVVIFGCAFVFAVSLGGQHIGQARWLDAAGAYGIAGFCLAGMIRELGRAIPTGHYPDDTGHAPRTKTAKPLGRLHAARTARREMRSSGCGCTRYWATAGAEHDDWCPQRRWSLT
ncbi:hypothetical protein ABZ682_22735 [Streptomyces griseoviridis]|uniref:hypothetical protein n=1 Tax=Streptomyces griseoviridis TaxID=45398 RepID=UPI0033EF5348